MTGQSIEVEERKTKAPQSLVGTATQSWQLQRKLESQRNRESELGRRATVGRVTQAREHSRLNLSSDTPTRIEELELNMIKTWGIYRSRRTESHQEIEGVSQW